jgi:Tfp pilus assembly ATPase PilU
MLANSVIQRLIRDEKIHEISPNMAMGMLEGMQTMDQALACLVQSGIVTEKEALKRSYSQAKLNELLRNRDKSRLTPAESK